MSSPAAREAGCFAPVESAGKVVSADRPSDGIAKASSPPPALQSTLKSARRTHLVWLFCAAAVPLLGWMMDVRGETAVGLRGVSAFALPDLCAMRRLFGVGCPGCGLTRSVVHLVHGDLQGSLARHRLGWLIFAAVLLQIPYRLLALAGRAPRWLEYAAQSEAAWATLAILLIVHWTGGWLGWS